MTLASSLLSSGYWLLMTFLSPQIPPPQADQARSAELRGERDEILAGERKKLRALADRLRAEGKAAEADRVAPGPADSPSADGSSRFVPLAEVVEARPKVLANIEIGQDGRAQAEAIRAETAKSLFDLAGKAARPPGSSFALADECLRGVIDRQPDHAEARRLLGFLPLKKGGWATPYAAKMLDGGNVLDPTYGWVPADWVPHLKRGELPARDRKSWLPAAQADALRAEWSKGWQIPTEHFFIKTNVPLSDAISFGRKLEALHQLFFALMADVIGPENLPLAQRFRNPKLQPAPPSKKTFQVFYFATRDEYAEHLAPFQGEGARKSLGTYVPRKESRQFGGVSYFFNDVGGQLDVTATLYHEASHQLLFESAGPEEYMRNVGNYWVFEGLGTYFETLQHEPDGSLRIGGLIGPRIESARDRLIQKHEFIPIEPFVAMSQPRFWAVQGGGSIHLNYAEAMALAVFLMQADGERHREGFLDYVRDAYKGRFRGGEGRPLEDRVGIPYPELDKAFLDYLEHGPKPRP